jgi:hypothetical protein
MGEDPAFSPPNLRNLLIGVAGIVVAGLLIPATAEGSGKGLGALLFLAACVGLFSPRFSPGACARLSTYQSRDDGGQAVCSWIRGSQRIAMLAGSGQLHSIANCLSEK